MIKYKYTLGNQSIETLNISDIPAGVSYETINFELVEEEGITEPILTINQVIFDLVTKQVEVMSEEEKIELLTLLNA